MTAKILTPPAGPILLGGRIIAEPDEAPRANGKSRGCDSYKNTKKGLDNLLLVIVPLYRNRKGWKNHDGLGGEEQPGPQKKENQ
jgi:hypothetical protein